MRISTQVILVVVLLGVVLCFAITVGHKYTRKDPGTSGHLSSPPLTSSSIEIKPVHFNFSFSNDEARAIVTVGASRSTPLKYGEVFQVNARPQEKVEVEWRSNSKRNVNVPTLNSYALPSSLTSTTYYLMEGGVYPENEVMTLFMIYVLPSTSSNRQRIDIELPNYARPKLKRGKNSVAEWERQTDPVVLKHVPLFTKFYLSSIDSRGVSHVIDTFTISNTYTQNVYVKNGEFRLIS